MTSTPPRPPLAELLGMSPHEEGGWYTQTWKTGRAVDYRPYGYSGPRAAASGIYYYLDAGEKSRWHRVKSDEAWLWHRGGRLRLAIAPPGPCPDLSAVTSVDLGPGIEQGARPCFVVPADHWQAAYPLDDDGTLVSCVVAPSFHYDDFTIVDPAPAPRVRAQAGAVIPFAPEQVWPHIAAFDDLASWHPLITESHHHGGPADPSCPGHLRALTTTDGARITERLVELTAQPGHCTYEFVHAPFPVTAYTATLTITRAPDSAGSHLTWSADFTPLRPEDGEDLKNTFTDDVFAAGLLALTRHIEDRTT
ncbi:cupin domain-containing protein [Streptomyces sp. cg28]|uniref:cupin domain-containing protein n=1 Tax=Streptomyces sp. cg28 TaxID=3403457 RepID=UPI003B22544D